MLNVLGNTTMKTLLAAAAALCFVAGAAHAAAPGVSCDTNVETNAGNGNSNAAPAPTGSTCATLVSPNGEATLQNGPGTTDNGADKHESGGNGAAK